MVVHDYINAVKDRGIMAGISAHNPDVIKMITDDRWKVSFLLLFLRAYYY